MSAAPTAFRPTVDIVVVTYNARDWTKRCLTNIAGQIAECDDGRRGLIVVDNASSDMTVDELEEWAGPHATVWGAPENLGFGAACNRGVQRSTADYIVLVNPDAIVEPDAVDVLVDFHRSHPGVGIVGGRVTKPDGSLDRGSCWGRQTLWSLLCFATGLSAALPRWTWSDPEGLGAWQRDSVRRVGVVTGCLLLIERPLWMSLRGFDERFFMYGEDADLCARADDAGWQSWITPAARAVHANGASSTTKLRKQVLLFRGKVTLTEHTRPAGLGRALILFGVALRTVAERSRRRPGQWSELWRARAEWSRGHASARDGGSVR